MGLNEWWYASGVSWVSTNPDAEEKRARVLNHMHYLLTINTHNAARGSVSSHGVAHEFGVCLLEVWYMVRGGKNVRKTENGGSLPRFVDVQLTAEARAAFLANKPDADEVLYGICVLLGGGYRVGCSYSGERHSFIVSLTCREHGDANEGLCMTSFASDLVTALSLALFKHYTLCEGVWTSGGAGESDLFG